MNLRNLLKEINDNGGVSYNFTTGDYNPTDGYMVSLPGFEMAFDKVEEQTIKDYITKNLHDLVDNNAYFGAWVDRDIIYFDVSVKIEDLYEACYAGIVNEQLAIYDNANAVAIHLPSPQKSGTFTQQTTYNRMLGAKTVEKYLAKL